MADYPSELERIVQLPDGTQVLIRPIRPSDADIEQAFVRGLSAESRYFRFMDTLRELTPAMLRQFTEIDYDRHMALIAVLEGPDGPVEIGVARYIAGSTGTTCEFALVVADAWQGRGLGRRLMGALIDAARAHGLATMFGDVMASNHGMLHLMKRIGFALESSPDDPHLCRVLLDLRALPPPNEVSRQPPAQPL